MVCCDGAHHGVSTLADSHYGISRGAVLQHDAESRKSVVEL